MLKEQIVADRFRFKQFYIDQEACTMKVGTDGILLGAWASVDRSQNILDIGTGTGLISLMLAQRAPDAQIHAVEISKQACQQAAANFAASPWSENLSVFSTPIQDYAAKGTQKYDLIVSNPPFFSGGTLSASHSRNQVRHTVKLPTGDLLSSVRNLLHPQGRFCIILPYIEGLRCKERAATYGLLCTKLVRVIPKPNKSANRLLIQFEKQAKETLQISLIVRNMDDRYSEDFINLTKDFYLFM